MKNRYDPVQRVSIKCTVPTKTVQSGKKDADINQIMLNAQRGMVIRGTAKVPYFADVSEVRDFHKMQISIANAKQEFMKLPALVRRRFENDVVQCVEFLSDPKNYDEAVSLGLLVPKNKVKVPAAPNVSAPGGADGASGTVTPAVAK